MNDIHYSVLLHESIEMLNLKHNGVYVDATLGIGGHSQEILKHIKNGWLYCFDQDETAITLAKRRLNEYDNFTIIKSNFSNLKNELKKHGVNKIDGIIYDLGVSSLQFDSKERGFSYRFDALLDMRMDLGSDLDAKYVVNNYSEIEIANIIYMYGGEKFSRSIAKNICKCRKQKQIETTFELVDIIKSSLPQKELRKKGHPAKKTFQALRIEVNKELDVLKKSLEEAVSILNVGGRIGVISFQSLEDIIAKSYFNSLINIDYPKDIPILDEKCHPVLKKISRKNIKPTLEELEVNSRSKSAQLRVVEKVREYEK
ncbi:MAG: 16S rRNA (cytosine(1402)-N(4))-methyltransferase RsmH [Bacilli bacterium]